MQAIPGIRVYSPCDARDLEWAVADAMAHHGPTYVRLARFPSPVRLGAEDSTGGFRFLRRATGPVVVTTGTLASEVLGAAEALATEGRELSVVGVRQVKPLAPDLVTALGPGPLSLAVAEEHNVHGGLADAVSALLDNHHVCHCLERIGIDDRFGESGPPAALLEHLGLAGEALASRLRAWHDYSVLQAAAAQTAPGAAGTV